MGTELRLGAVLLALSALPQAHAAVTVEPEAALLSRYLWRGITFVPVWVAQPGLTVYPGDSGVYAGVWSSIPLVDRQTWGEVDEVDPYVGWFGEGTLGGPGEDGVDGLGWWVDTCLFAYTLPRLPADDSTAELQLRAGLDHWSGPNMVFAQDLRFWGAGTYLELGLAPELTLGGDAGVRLTPGLAAGASTYSGSPNIQVAAGSLAVARDLGPVVTTLEGGLQWSPDSTDANGLSPAIGLTLLGSF